MELQGTSNSFEAESEIYFLLAQFLKGGPCKKTLQVLEEELKEHALLPVKYDIAGGKHLQSLEELAFKHPHIGPDTILHFCNKLLEFQRKGSTTVGVSSFLASGRFSLLHGSGKPSKLPLITLYARRRGCLLSTPANVPLKSNLVLTLEARRMGGPVSRKNIIWPKLYNRIQLLNQTCGHISAVYCVLFDQTGHFIFTGADDLLVKVWSTVSGRLLASFRGASSEITDLAVNLENTLLAAGSLDRVLYVWCLQTTSLVAQLSAPVGMITGVNFCPTVSGSYRYLASTSTDGSVAFWLYTHQPLGKDTLFLGHPILFNEKMRPGVAQMICSAFSPGGTFLAAGSADHHVRVYLIPGNDGPQRIMEEEAHTDRVDSIQWANRGLRFVSGSKDGSALVWRFVRQKWTNIKLDITAELPGHEVSDDSQRQKPKLFMVCWDKTDKWVVTAVHDASLKVWNSETGALINVLRTHRRDVFVLEPHPMDEGIMLSAGHDGLLCIWDIRTGNCLFQYQNLIGGQGHGSFYDAKWSPDGTLIAATDSHGHILLFGLGAPSLLLKKLPQEMFFNTDYWPLLRDESRGLLDETTGEAPHLMAAPFLVNVEGTPYPPHLQRLVPGREHDSCTAATIPRASSQFPPNLSRENGIAPGYFPSAELSSSRGNTPNAWLSRMLLPTLPSQVIHRIRSQVDALGEEERNDYERQKILPEVTPQKPIIPLKEKKKRPRQPYRTRAVADDNEFMNPDNLDLSLSSNPSSASASMCSDDGDSSEDSGSSSEYSDWIADHGVSLEPPTRARRRRQPAKLSPSPTPKRKRTRPKTEDNAEQSDGSSEDDVTTPDNLKEVPAEFMPPKWLSEVVPRKAPYYPQMGDHVMFFQEGYKLYLEAVRKKQVYKPSTRDSFSRLGLSDPIFSQVIGIKYEIRPPRLCCLRLAVMTARGTMTNRFFNIKYHDVPDVIDFLVLKQTYDIAMDRNWQPGDRFRCMIDDSWWLGSIVSRREDERFPDSPFLSFLTKWDNGEDEPMSPWDLEPVDLSRQPSEPGGSVDVLPEETLTLLYSPRPDEWPNGDRDAICQQIVTALELVMSLSIAEPFSAPVDLIAYPTYAIAVEYPIDLSTIKARLENRFYRRLTALQFDVRYLATNAEKFNDVHSVIVKHARIITDLCLRIIKEPFTIDVMAVYHQLVDAYHSTSESDDEGGSSLRFNSNHVDWKGDCEKLLLELTALPDAAPFREPVDLNEFPDYLQVVETPMDLSTVRQDLMADNYNTPRDFFEAVRLIFTNSKTYNTNKRSRIFSMSVRLSNLFEARMKKLITEWKVNRRKRIKQTTRQRKLRLQSSQCLPGPSQTFSEDEHVDPLRVSGDDEPKPSTSRGPNIIRISRIRNDSDSDENTNLSVLQCNLRKSESEDDPVRNGNGPLRLRFKLQNGEGSNTTTSENDDEDRVLSTLTHTSNTDALAVNGHSYAKPSLNGGIKNGLISTIDEESLSQESEEDDTTKKSPAAPKVEVNGCGDGSTTTEEENETDENISSPSWSNEEGHSGSDSGSFTKTSKRRTRLRSRPQTRRKEITTRSTRASKRARKKKESSDEDLSVENETENSSESDDNVNSNDDDDDLPLTRSRIKDSSDEEDSSENESSDSEEFRPRRRKRKKCSGSDSSGWQPSGNEASRSSTRKRRRRRQQESESDDPDLPSSRSVVSSRGRVRKITERAREAFKKRR